MTRNEAFEAVNASWQKQNEAYRINRRLNEYKRKINRRQARYDKLLVRFCAGMTNGQIWGC